MGARDDFMNNIPLKFLRSEQRKQLGIFRGKSFKPQQLHGGKYAGMWLEILNTATLQPPWLGYLAAWAQMKLH